MNQVNGTLLSAKAQINGEASSDVKGASMRFLCVDRDTKEMHEKRQRALKRNDCGRGWLAIEQEVLPGLL